MEFDIEIKVDGKKYHYKAEFMRQTIAYEVFHVYGKNGKMVLQNNGPRQARYGIKLPAHWHIESGELANKEFQAKIIEAVGEWREANKQRLTTKDPRY